MEDHLSISRIIRHRRDLVFKCWTNRQELQKWFAPRGCRIMFSKLELRTGGEFHWCVKSPGYPDCWCTGVFLEINEPKIIRYSIKLADENGNPVSAEKMFKNKEWPDETIVSVTFIEREDFTEIIIDQTVVERVARKTGAYKGWIEMLNILEENITLNELNVTD